VGRPADLTHQVGPTGGIPRQVSSTAAGGVPATTASARADPVHPGQRDDLLMSTADLSIAPRQAQVQGGVFTAAQARADGWTSRQVRRRLTAGRWLRVAGDGLALPAPRWTAFQLAVAVRLTWPGSVAGHGTAALLHGMPVPAEQVAEVITDKGHRSRRSIRAHVASLTPSEIDRLPNGLPLTTLRRTAADCLAGLHPDRRWSSGPG
jgi:hypothetical protein